MNKEEKLERIAEKEMDRLDSELLSGSITQEEYDKEVKKLDIWIRGCISNDFDLDF